MNPESEEIIKNARAAAFSDPPEITIEQLHAVYRHVAYTEAERELE